MKEKINVLLLKDYPTKYNLVSYIIWKYIEKKIKHKYDITYFYEEYNNLSDQSLIDKKINSDNYDIIIIPYPVFYRNLKNMSYSHILYVTNNLPIFTLSQTYNKYNHIYYFKIIKTIMYFLVISILLSIITSVLISYINNKKLMSIFYITLNSYLEANKDFFTTNINKNTFIIFIITSIIIFVLYIILNTIVSLIANTFNQPYNLINFTIRNQKILVNKYESNIIKRIKIKNGSPIITEKNGYYLIKEYINNNHKYDGFYCNPWFMPSYKINHNKIIFNEITNKFFISTNLSSLGYTELCFPINSNKKKLISDINNVLFNSSNNNFIINPLGNRNISQQICPKKIDRKGKGLFHNFIIDVPCDI